MSNISSTDARPVKLMRWVARFLSIPWAIFVLLFSMFAFAYGIEEGSFSIAVYIIIIIIVALMSLGPAILASVWGQEAIGGGLLIAAGVLILGGNIYSLFIYSGETPLGGLEFALVLPPLVAGSLFLACHRRSKTSGEQPV
jgi:peptidoglycan/LPS O-acetylase OafA/YrhL